MPWAISYTSNISQIAFQVCADIGGGYFYILMPNSTVLPSTVGGISIAANLCTNFTAQATEFTQTGTYTMVLADNTPQEVTKAQVWFYVTPTPFTVAPPSGNSSATYQCIANQCTQSPCQVGTAGCYTDSNCMGVCAVAPPLCQEINILGQCIPKTYLLVAGVGIAALLIMK